MLVSLIAVIASATHHVLRDLVEVCLDPGGQAARNHLVRALQLPVVESFLPVLHFLALIFLHRFLYLGQPNKLLSLSLLGLRSFVSRVGQF